KNILGWNKSIFCAAQYTNKYLRWCFYGWVILSYHPHWSLWNPVTLKFINLPHLIDKRSAFDGDDDIGYCCLSSPPDDPNSIILMTRTEKPHFVFCRLYPKRKKLRWTEISTGADGFLQCLTCCNGKVFAHTIASHLFVELSIVVKDTGVVINLSSLLMFPSPLNGCNRIPYLVGSCKDIFSIFIDLDEVTEAIGNVYLFKLNMNRKTWEEPEDLNDVTISLEIGSYLYPGFHSLAISSELGGYIHILGENGKIVYSYHVKDKTFSSSSLPCLVGTSHVSAWAMLDCDHKQEKDKNDKIVVSKVESDGFEFNGMTNESHLLYPPFDVLKMILEFSVGIEYMYFVLHANRVF
nr:PAZ domain-containing protein [Tanacetum cinerariifolium]